MKTNCTRVHPDSQRGMEPLLCKAEGMNVAIHWMDKDSSNRQMSRGLSCVSIAKLKQLKRRKSSGSLNTGVQTKINERSGDNLERLNIHMGMKMTNILYPHPLDLPKIGKNLVGVGLQP